MKEVVNDVAAQHFEVALVRLWYMAEGPQLVEWENSERMSLLEADADSFSRMLQMEEPLTVESLERSPIAFIRALDRFVASLGTDQRPLDEPYLVDGKGYWVLPVDRKGRSNASLSKQRGNRARWFPRHAIVPAVTRTGKYNVSVCVPSMALAQKLAAVARVDGGGLNVWIGHFDDACCVEWDAGLLAQGRYRAVSLEDRAKRGRSISETVDIARESGAHVIVLPELSVDLTHRADLQAQLVKTDSELLFVLAGSFHEAKGAKWFNTAPLLDASTGDALIEPRKLRAYGQTGDPENGVSERSEFIDVGDVVHVLVTELGNMTVLICKDFLDADQSVATLLQEVPVDWVLVPSYGDKATVDGHRRKAKEVSTVTIGANVAVANIRNIRMSEGECLPGFVWPSGAKTEPAPVMASGGLVRVRLCEALPTLSRPSLKRVK